MYLRVESSQLERPLKETSLVLVTSSTFHAPTAFHWNCITCLDGWLIKWHDDDDDNDDTYSASSGLFWCGLIRSDWQWPGNICKTNHLSFSIPLHVMRSWLRKYIFQDLYICVNQSLYSFKGMFLWSQSPSRSADTCVCDSELGCCISHKALRTDPLRCSLEGKVGLVRCSWTPARV